MCSGTCLDEDKLAWELGDGYAAEDCPFLLKGFQVLSQSPKRTKKKLVAYAGSRMRAGMEPHRATSRESYPVQLPTIDE